MRSLVCLVISVGSLSANGCGSEPPAVAGPAEASPPVPGAPSAFSPATCGTITGLVTWVGPLPDVPAVTRVTPRPDGSGYDTRPLAPANAPRIDRSTRGLCGAVVYLRGVEPQRAKPWDLPPAGVEIRDSHITVVQGNRTARTGFVPVGGSVLMRSAEPEFQVLRARGAAFFALPFPEPDQPLSRTFEACGRVELSSAAGYFWQSADLFVCDHPYYALSDSDGRFHFTQVPAGEYDLVAWHPNWLSERIERNPESGMPSRVYYAPPLECSRPVTVSPARTTLKNLTLPR